MLLPKTMTQFRVTNAIAVSSWKASQWNGQNLNPLLIAHVYPPDGKAWRSVEIWAAHSVARTQALEAFKRSNENELKSKGCSCTSVERADGGAVESWYSYVIFGGGERMH